jgi:peptidoglycan hydrolase CwlO-like protein
MAKKKGDAEAAEPRSGWKQILYGASIVIALAGSLVLIVFTFLLNDAIDKTRDLVLANVQDIQNDLTSLDGTLSSAEDELDMVNSTLSGLQGTFTPLETGLRKTGDAIGGMATTVSAVPLIGQSVPVADLKSAAASMTDAAAELNKTAATFEQHKADMSNLKDKVEGIRQSVSDQKATLDKTATSLGDIFGLVKLANFLFFLVVLSMFTMLVIDSAAGLL